MFQSLEVESSLITNGTEKRNKRSRTIILMAGLLVLGVVFLAGTSKGSFDFGLSEKMARGDDLAELGRHEDAAFALEAAKLENAGNPELLKDNKEYEKMKTHDDCVITTNGGHSFTNGECTADSSHRILGGPYVSNGRMTIIFCERMCEGMGYELAGVQYSSWCFCGNQFTRTPVKTNRCTMKCAGDHSKICGGTWANNVYFSLGALTNGNRLVGCLRDQASRSLNGKHMNNGHMTVAMCQNFCKGFTYYGLQYSSWCFCGNTFTHGKKLATNCNMPCSGNPSQVCGGAWANSVYRS